MIHYKRGGRWHLINLFQMRGSLFPGSFLVALPCSAVAFFLKQYNIIVLDSVLLNNTAWSGFSALVGFLVVFRTSEAYSRFWQGCTATHQMRAEWIDAASAIMSFCKHSTAQPDEINRFKHLVVRLFSLLHAMALGEIEECEDFDDLSAHNLELIDPLGLDRESWRTLRTCHNKVTLVFTWLQTVIVENIKTGVLSIPPPILSRVFQELANGMVCLHEAQKISNIPFPFPYAQTCDALLFMHWIITPVVTAQWSAHPIWAVVFSFVQVFILWSLNNIAVEIEHPFGDDANDLDASQMQTDMNLSLLLVLSPAATRSPVLSSQAEIDNLVALGRRASHRVPGPSSSEGSLRRVKSYNDVLSDGHPDRSSARSGMASFWASVGSDEETEIRSSWSTKGPHCAAEDASVGSGEPVKEEAADAGGRSPRRQPPAQHMERVTSPQVKPHDVGDTVSPSPLGTPRRRSNAAGAAAPAAGAGTTGGTGGIDAEGEAIPQLKLGSLAASPREARC